MYCSVYGCTSSSKNNSDGLLHFFAFPNADKGPEEKKRTKLWTDFCKRKGFTPTKNACICSQHFDSDSYLPAQSPEFLKSINFVAKRKVKLKDGALPTLNKPLDEAREKINTVKIRARGALSRLKDVNSILNQNVKEKEVQGEEILELNKVELVDNIPDNDDENVPFRMRKLLPVRNKSTQITARPCRCSEKKQVKSVATQTFLGKEGLPEQLFITRVHSVSLGTQTQDVSCSLEVENPVLSTTNEDTSNAVSDVSSFPMELLNAGVDDIRSSEMPDCNYSISDLDDCDSDSDNGTLKDEEFDADFKNDDSEDQDEFTPDTNEVHKEKYESVLLSHNKLPQDQMKFIVFEESLVKCFEHCFKCDSVCAVCLESTIGAFCRISVKCLGDINHAFVLSTGPLHNRLPLFHLMFTSGILSSGLECAKVFRLFNSLNIPCIQRREFSDLQSAYVIPAVVNIWNKEKASLLQEIKGTSRCIASDMRVDSPGHTGLFGSGSSLDVEKNVILDTQIIKVFRLKHFLV